MRPKDTHSTHSTHKSRKQERTTIRVSISKTPPAPNGRGLRTQSCDQPFKESISNFKLRSSAGRKEQNRTENRTKRVGSLYLRIRKEMIRRKRVARCEKEDAIGEIQVLPIPSRKFSPTHYVAGSVCLSVCLFVRLIVCLCVCLCAHKSQWRSLDAPKLVTHLTVCGLVWHQERIPNRHVFRSDWTTC